MPQFQADDIVHRERKVWLLSSSGSCLDLGGVGLEYLLLAVVVSGASEQFSAKAGPCRS